MYEQGLLLVPSLEEFGWLCMGQASKSSSSRGSALKAVIVVPDWHNALLLVTMYIQGDAS
jgi:hypothetical protein